MYRVHPRVALLTALVVSAGCESTTDPSVVTTIEITPSTPELEILGSTVQLSARTLNADGDPIDPEGRIGWSVSQTSVASITETGLLTANGVGGATVTASVDGVSGTAQVRVLGVQSPDFLVDEYTVMATQHRPGGNREWVGAARGTRVSGGRAVLQRIVLEEGGEVGEIRSLIGSEEVQGGIQAVLSDGVQGQFSVMTGGFGGGRARFDTGARLGGGEVRLLRWDPVRVDGFGAAIERSTDGGVTWEPEWTFVFEKATVSLPDVPASPACADAEHQFFDFWVGDWDVTTPGGQSAGTNLVQSVAGGCAVQENYVSGLTATSLTGFDPVADAWWQVYMDSEGNVLELRGGPDDESLVLTGFRGTIEDRFTWTPRGDGTVRQLYEANGGAGWVVQFDGIYTMR